MHKFFTISAIGIIFAFGSSILSPSWGASVVSDDSIMPCDKVRVDNKPCSTDSDIIKRPAPVPTEKRTIIIPPEIPAEKLPDRKKMQPRQNSSEPSTLPQLD